MFKGKLENEDIILCELLFQNSYLFQKMCPVCFMGFILKSFELILQNLIQGHSDCNKTFNLN